MTGAGERGFEPRKSASALWHGVPRPRASEPHLFAVAEMRDRSWVRISVSERAVGAGVRELETFGRRLAETQGVPGHASVDWVAYGRAAQDALRKGNGIPLVGPFLAPERSSSLGGARGLPSPTPPRPVPIRMPQGLSQQTSGQRKYVLRVATSASLSRAWQSRLTGPAGADRRFLSRAWCAHMGAAPLGASRSFCSRSASWLRACRCQTQRS
jgi:hypothetical protein